ncbi:UNVERIFIED_CONTAM: hypothetical protein PYX00_011837 [Menopon gallinae]|uniref:Symplekin C-terminal domain-containing protein n=1 Tax=Menopon gallinae TaxID=328185 RepID=A0AAW2H8T9_9NEOP
MLVCWNISDLISSEDAPTRSSRAERRKSMPRHSPQINSFTPGFCCPRTCFPWQRVLHCFPACTLLFAAAKTYPMNTPDKAEPDAVDSKQLVQLMMGFRSLNYLRKMHVLCRLCSSITRDNATLVLSFVLGLSENPVEMPSIAARSLHFHFGKLRSILLRHLPPECLPFLETIKQLAITDPVTTEFDEHEYLVSRVLEALITYSTREIENFVKNFHEPREMAYNEFSFSKYFLEKAQESWSRLKDCKRYVMMSLHEEEVLFFVEFVDNNRDKACEIFLSAYIFNRKFYDAVEHHVYSHELQSLYETLPRIDMARINLASLEFSTYEKLVIGRPRVRETLLDALTSGVVAYERPEIVGLVADNYDIFAPKIEMFSFSIEESLEIAEKNEGMVQHILKDIGRFETPEITKIAVFLHRKDESFIKSLFAPVLDSKDKNWIALINSYLLSKPLSEDLRGFFLNHLSDDPSYFYSLMPYFKKEKNLEALSKLLVDEASLKHFLRVFTLNEIFYFAHYVPNIESAKNITKLCIDNSSFNESVVMFAIPKMEMDVLPPLFMRSVILSYMRLPSLKKFVIGLLYKLVKRAIWLDPGLFEGFIKTLEIMGSESVGVIAQMPSDTIAEVLKKSRKLVGISKRYFAEGKGVKDRNERRLRSILLTLR